MKTLFFLILLFLCHGSTHAQSLCMANGPVLHSVFDERPEEPLSPVVAFNSIHLPEIPTLSPQPDGRKRISREARFQTLQELRIKKGNRGPKLLVGGGVIVGIGIAIVAAGISIASKELHPLTSGYLVVLAGGAVTIAGLSVMSVGLYYKLHYGKYVRKR